MNQQASLSFEGLKNLNDFLRSKNPDARLQEAKNALAADDKKRSLTRNKLLAKLVPPLRNRAESKTDKVKEQVRQASMEYEMAWETAEGVMSLFPQVEPGNLDSLKEKVALELRFWDWFGSLDPSALPAITNAVEKVAAHLDAAGTVEGLDSSIISLLGSDNVADAPVFVEWFHDQVPSFRVENGHLALALSDPTGAYAVHHAGKSNDPGLCERIWESTARHWSWMKSHLGGFAGAGLELMAIGHEKMGRILTQSANLAEEQVCMKMALYGGADMAISMREVLEAEPFAGGVFNPALISVVGSSFGPRIKNAVEVGDGTTMVLWGGNTFQICEIDNGNVLRTIRRADRRFGTCIVVDQTWIVTTEDYSDPRVGRSFIGVTKLDGTVLATYTPVKKMVYGLTDIGEGSFVSFGRSGSIDVWEISPEGELIHKMDFPGHKGAVKGVILLNQGEILASVSKTKLLVHEMSSGALVETFERAEDEDREVFVLQNGTSLSLDPLGVLHAWTVNEESGAHENVQLAPASVDLAITVLDNGYLVTGSDWGQLCVWTFENGEAHLLGRARVSPYSDVCVINAVQRHRALVVAMEGTVLVDLAYANLEKELAEDGSRDDFTSVNCGLILSNGAVMTGQDNINVWRKPLRGEGAQLLKTVKTTEVVKALCRVNNGFAWGGWYTLCLSEGPDGPLQLIDAVEGYVESMLWMPEEADTFLWLDGTGVKSYSLSKKKITRVKARGFSHMAAVDGSCVLIAGDNVSIVNFQTKIVRCLMGNSGRGTAVDSMLALPDNRVLVAWDTAKVFIIDACSGDFEPVTEAINRFYAWLGDGNVLVMMGEKIAVWNMIDCEVRASLRGLRPSTVVDVSWDAEHRLAAFFLNTHDRWIIYEL